MLSISAKRVLESEARPESQLLRSSRLGRTGTSLLAEVPSLIKS